MNKPKRLSTGSRFPGDTGFTWPEPVGGMNQEVGWKALSPEEQLLEDMVGGRAMFEMTPDKKARAVALIRTMAAPGMEDSAKLSGIARQIGRLATVGKKAGKLGLVAGLAGLGGYSAANAAEQDVQEAVEHPEAIPGSEVLKEAAIWSVPLSALGVAATAAGGYTLADRETTRAGEMLGEVPGDELAQPGPRMEAGDPGPRIRALQEALRLPTDEELLAEDAGPSVEDMLLALEGEPGGSWRGRVPLRRPPRR